MKITAWTAGRPPLPSSLAPNLCPVLILTYVSLLGWGRVRVMVRGPAALISSPEVSPSVNPNLGFPFVGSNPLL